ncbi:alpha/beta hydrolase [Paraburkholderia sp. C35]|uniref:alpha/beta fold hydrolase n=1 Tax=Paraburkholderia sp. C35 TaxID=2126993 RepID=UPI000D695C1F|nr:alpha/beta hydrolase [Paraburkholderia sp. C35]
MTRAAVVERGQEHPDLGVLIHGFLDRGRSWGALARSFPASWDVRALDLRGAGRLATSEGPYSLEQAVQDVVDVIKQADARRVARVGNSMGCLIAELVAVAIPEKVAALVLLTPTPLGGLELPAETRELLRESGGNQRQQRLIRERLSLRLAPEQIEQMTDLDGLMGKDAAHGYYDAFSQGHPLGKEPSQFKGATLIVASTSDPSIPLALVQQIRATRFPDSSLETIDDSGHWPHVEQPVRTGKLVADFLSSIPGG